MTSAEQQQSARNQRFAAGLSDLRIGSCLSINWAARTAKVNIPGSTVDMPMVVTPVVNARCYVGFFANRPVVLGPAALPPLATATASPSGGLVKVTGDDGVSYTVASDGFTISAGTRVLLAWGDRGGYVIGLPTADPLSGQPINSGGTAPSSGRQSRTFNPIDSGTQNGSGGSGSGNFWTPQVWCGDSTIGGYFYGGQIADTIPDSAVIDGVQVSLVQVGGSGGGAPTLGLHNLLSKSGSLAPTGAAGISGGTGVKGLPTSFGDALKTGTYVGLATAHGGYWIWGSAGEGSGALTISWH
jgi:hypothetical protein